MAVADIVLAAAESAGINPPQLAVQVANVESGLNPNIPDGQAGEVGVMQLLPSSFPRLNLRDLQTNVTTGVNYLAQQISNFGDLFAGVAAYNCGPSCVASAMARYGTANYAWLAGVPASTLNYLVKVFGSLPSTVPTSLAQPGALISESSGATVPDSTQPQTENVLPYIGLAFGAVLLLWLFL